MMFVLIIGFLLVAALSAAHFFKSPFGVMLPTTLFALTLVLYIFGMFDLLQAGFVVVLMGVAGMAVAAFIHNGPKRFLRSGRAAFTPSLVVFVGLALLTFILTREMKLVSWDEFSEWGTVVRATYLYDKISVYNPIDLLFRSYPPGLSLFEYLVAKLSGGWSEGNLFWAFQLFIGSLFFPFMRGVSWRSLGKLVIVLPLMALTPILFFASFQVIIVDPFLGLLFGYCLALVYVGDLRSRRFSVHLSLALVMLVLTKDTGAYFSLVVLAALLAKYLYQRYSRGLREVVRGALFTFGIPSLAVAVTYTSWKAILAILHTPLVFSTPNSLGALGGLVDGTAPGYWSHVISGFGSALRTFPIAYARGVPINQISWVIIAAVALAVLELSRGDRWGRRRDFSLAVTVLVGAIIYTVGLLVLYLFSFGEYEAVHLASFGRYLGTYWVGVTMLVSLAAIELVAGEIRALGSTPTWRSRFVSPGLGYAVVWLAILAISAPAKTLLEYVRDPVAQSMTARANYFPVLDTAKKAGLSGRDHVWIISEYTEGYEYWILRYELMPSPVAPGGWSLGKPKNAADIWTADITAKSWADQLRGYDYVLIYKTNDQFKQTYGSLFTSPSDVTNNSVFKVEVVDGTVKLKRVP